jgi:hypothetical protein
MEPMQTSRGSDLLPDRVEVAAARCPKWAGCGCGAAVARAPRSEVTAARYAASASGRRTHRRARRRAAGRSTRLTPSPLPPRQGTVRLHRRLRMSAVQPGGGRPDPCIGLLAASSQLPYSAKLTAAHRPASRRAGTGTNGHGQKGRISCSCGGSREPAGPSTRRSGPFRTNFGTAAPDAARRGFRARGGHGAASCWSSRIGGLMEKTGH